VEMSLSAGTQWGKITLWDAAADGNLELCKQRLSSSWTKVNAQDAQGKTALHEATRYGHIEVVKFLISKGGDPKVTTVDGTTALQLAAQNGHDSLVKYLVTRQSGHQRSRQIWRYRSDGICRCGKCEYHGVAVDSRCKERRIEQE